MRHDDVLAPTSPTREGVRAYIAALADVPVDRVTDNDHLYDDLDVDSLTRLRLVVGLERAFGVTLDDDESAGLDEVSDVIALLEAKGVLRDA